MSFGGLLVHRCRILRRSGQLDRFQQPLRKDRGGYSQIADMPCRMSEKSGGERFSERSRDVVSESSTVFLPANADIREDDLIEVYDPRNGFELVADGNITQVKRVYDGISEHHREVRFESIRGSGSGGSGDAA